MKHHFLLGALVSESWPSWLHVVRPTLIPRFRQRPNCGAVFRAFEAEDSTAFWAEFEETARGTGVNAPTTLSARRWARCMGSFGPSSYEIVGDLHFCLASTLKPSCPTAA